MRQTRFEQAAQQRKERFTKYFAKTPDPHDRSIALLLLGVAAGAFVIALAGFASGSGFLGVVGLLGAGFAAYKGFLRKNEYDRAYEKAEPKPSDAEVDARLAEDLITIVRRAMERLGLTYDDLESAAQHWDPIANLSRGGTRLEGAGRRPLVVFGPTMPAAVAVGKDDVWRFSAYQVMVICPTSYHLAIYRTGLDFLTGGLRQEETQEYHYSDVVAVSTTSTPGQELNAELTAEGDSEKVRFARTILREFQIVVASGDRSKVVVGIADESDPEREATLQESRIDEVISSVRRMLREKKGGTVVPPTAPGGPSQW
jgi:hypothetical protein